MKSFFITTPIYYVNDKPHIGHAYTTLAADILARFAREKTQVFFLTGTDEHGIKIRKAAEIKGIEPKKFCDQMSALYQKTWKELDISYDFFIRTTDIYHEEFVKFLLLKLKEKKLIYEGEYEGYYCEGCEEFKNKKDLIDDCCPIHKTRTEIIKEKVWFFKLSSFQHRIIKAIGKNFSIYPKTREKEVLSFLKNQKLNDVAISRPKKRVKWGINLPWDENQVIYVWVDALFNYLSGPLSSVNFNFKNKHWEEIEETLADFWPVDWHLMAKDILRFHAIIWPAMLIALDLALPQKMFIHGYFTVEGDKMSKSLKNFVNPLDLKKKYGLASLRYYLFRDFSFGEDGDFQELHLIERYNSDLADNIGNLLARILTLIKKYGGVKQEIKFIPNEEIEALFSELKFKEILEKINLLAQEKNRLIDQEKPWKLMKEAHQGKEFAIKNPAQEKLEKIFLETMISLKQISYYLSFFLPTEGKKMKEALEKQEPAIIFPKIEEIN